MKELKQSNNENGIQSVIATIVESLVRSSQSNSKKGGMTALAGVAVALGGSVRISRIAVIHVASVLTSIGHPEVSECVG